MAAAELARNKTNSIKQNPNGANWTPVLSLIRFEIKIGFVFN